MTAPHRDVAALCVLCSSCADDVACAEPELCKQICGNPVGCTDTAYARLVMELLPVGEKLLHVPEFTCSMPA